MQSGVGKLSCNKTALKRCTSTETLWNRKAPSLSSPEDEEIFLPKLPKSLHADYYYYCYCIRLLRLRLVTEKEQLLRELRNVGSSAEAEAVRCRIRQLEHDLQQAVDHNTQQLDDSEYV